MMPIRCIVVEFVVLVVIPAVPMVALVVVPFVVEAALIDHNEVIVVMMVVIDASADAEGPGRNRRHKKVGP